MASSPPRTRRFMLTKLPDGTVGCLFETDHYGRIVFARFPSSWLETANPR